MDCPLFRQWLCGKADSGLERILCGVLVKRTPESMDRCSDCPDLTEILLKMALNTIQTINQYRAISLLSLITTINVEIGWLVVLGFNAT